MWTSTTKETKYFTPNSHVFINAKDAEKQSDQNANHEYSLAYQEICETVIDRMEDAILDGYKTCVAEGFTPGKPLTDLVKQLKDLGYNIEMKFNKDLVNLVIHWDSSK